MQFPVYPEVSKRMTSHRFRTAPIYLSSGVKLFKSTEPLLVLLTVVVDHYDQRNNETNYKKIADFFKKSGVAFAILSILGWALMEIF